LGDVLKSKKLVSNKKGVAGNPGNKAPRNANPKQMAAAVIMTTFLKPTATLKDDKKL
jgi:hypothetical protein